MVWARTALSRRRVFRELLWPSTDVALRRRRDASIVVAAVCRTLTGREPSPAERAELLTGVAQGLDFEGLVADLLATPEAMDRTAGTGLQAVRRMLERELEAGGEVAGSGMPRVVFLHIMKTGGTSLSHLLEQLAGSSRSCISVPLDDLLVMSTPRLKQVRAVSGHIPYEALGLLPGPFQTITVLREPVERTLSHYREVRRTAGVPGELTLDQFLADDRYAVPSGNYQARSLAHTVDLAGAWITYSPTSRYLQTGGREDQPYPLQSLFDSTPVALSDDQLLERAAANLSSVDLVGVTESLDGLGRRLCRLFGAPETSLAQLNVSEHTGSRDLPTHTRRLIEQRTAVDRELYELARRLSRA